eukprot:TRINITY_DN4579_c2_g1_i1.p1 TRINITY_DN4579_c2_g1~~TRINITY_DN4579_c2_g1_i1.p1  ORF type:complete len:262 (+),score=38.40 TRINITY_DN4579_c2_g1_i1:157-942(+)
MAYPGYPPQGYPPNPFQSNPNPYYSQPGNPYHNPYQTQAGPYGQQPQGMYTQPGYPPQPGYPGHPPHGAPPGHHAPPPAAPKGWFAAYYQQITPQEMAGLQNWFNTVDRDKSGSIEVQELQQITFEGRPIGPQAAAKLIQVFDEDRNGSISFQEYAIMHKFISHMRQAFLTADTDRSGRIEAKEIHQALTNAGFSYISMSTILELLHKYDSTRLGLDWPQFLIMVSQIAHVRSVFEWNDKSNSGWVTFNRDQMTQIAAFLA